MLTVTSMAGERSTFRIPSSSPRRSAASSKRTSADIQGLVSELLWGFGSRSAKVVVSNGMQVLSTHSMTGKDGFGGRLCVQFAEANHRIPAQ